ncbi:MAG TPA: DUF885 domain-containing protein [Candidatus Udaeobacter sp.]|jgi:uncharacterized protein (DUF885 family)|nr:DUF885 domain-containing protein [Candidatus Udaeobacter sp.]
MRVRTLSWLALTSFLIPAVTFAAGSTEPIARLCDEFWQGTLRASPTEATSLGDHRYDDQLEDNTPIGFTREHKRLEGVLARVRAIDPKSLSPADRLTRSTLELEARNEIDNMDCHFEEWVVDARSGPQTDFMSLPDLTVIITPEDGQHYLSRVRKMGPYIDHVIANLERGMKVGRVGTRAGVDAVLDQLDSLIAHPVTDWELSKPATARRDDWSGAQKIQFADALEAALDHEVKPAFVRYREFLRTKIQPVARTQDRAGLGAIPGGREAYLKRIRIETSLDRTPEQLHQLGLEQVAKVRQQLSELGAKVLGTSDIAEIQKKLRTDPAMHFATAEQVETKARQTLARAKAAIPQFFEVLPKADCQVKVMGMYEAPHSTIAYYREPAADGSRPGYYMINTYLPETRPRYEAEALAFHESIPGHHLQLAIAQELQNLPEFRRHLGVTAFVEGWGLYSERLADDMGLYSSDLDRIGMLSFDAWRDCRLVVDTGLHAMGWTRQQAIDYMVQNTVLAENNIANEVDRYLGDPGQALAYKVGQLEILALRDEGKKRLGDKFDLKKFHDVVLQNGAVALPTLREQVEAWYASEESAR